MTFIPKLGYLDDIDGAAYDVFNPRVRSSSVLGEPYTQWQAPLVVQQYSDCVERAVTSRMRARIVMQRAANKRDELELPDLPSARWAYWQYLESTGQLGTDPGTKPWDFIQLLNARGWCSERWMPYTNPDGSAPKLDHTDAPPPAALQHAWDQRRRLHAHIISDPMAELRIALREDLGVVIPIACDRALVEPGGVPNDPEFVWDFSDSSPVVGWHMLQVDGYDPLKGLRCPNTWGDAFGWGGYFWLGWDTVLNPLRAKPPIALDYVPLTSEELIIER